MYTTRGRLHPLALAASSTWRADDPWLGHEVSAFECDPGAGILCAMLLEPLLFERARRDAGC